MAGLAENPTGTTLIPARKPPETRLRVNVCGIVQGVGFRPFVYRLAHAFGLHGFIRNTSSGVLVEVQGPSDRLDGFLDALEHQAPPLARISELGRVEIACLPDSGNTGFIIDSSLQGSAVETLVPPDIATCEKCRAELFDAGNRRYRYPFINCTECGPRYTIVESIPYDRPFTSMKSFAMCGDCASEYLDPLDRRFHAQPDACAVCGPSVSLLDGYGEPVRTDDAIREAAARLNAGKIVAVKGIGGFHLAVDASNENAVRELRERKGREQKPFAVMMRDLACVGRFCLAGEAEAAALSSPEAPVVLLARRPDYALPEALAPGNGRLGVMLPYSPLHALLFEDGPDLLVMTSANFSDEPVLYDDREAFLRLRDIADFFLMHNRPILQRCDDSVAVHLSGALRLIRRSRGYVPAPVMLDRSGPPVLATGGELKNALCLMHARHAILSQHLGDMKNFETWSFFGDTVRHLKSLFRVDPELLVHDLHPGYLTTRWAMEQDIARLGVQHHHAHLAACLAENMESGPAIGLILDGTGYGPDGSIWGGEVLIGDACGADRFARLEYMPLPGGDSAILQPWRAALGYLFRSCSAVPDLPFLQGRAKSEVIELLEKNLSCPETSSCGRLFDVVASIAGVCSVVSYEGQAAVELMTAAQGSVGSEGFRYAVAEEGGCRVMQLSPLVRDVAAAAGDGMAPGEISRRFHRTLCDMLIDIAGMAARTTGIRQVALSGGVFQNMLLFETLVSELQGAGYRVLTHTGVPCNDGGLSLGQAAIGRQYLEGNYRGVRY
ncbi:MAG: carbamoyltransferase HypF [Chlorobium sp.]